MSATDSVPEPQEECGSDFFRCPVQADRGTAKIRIGRHRIPATVQETSIDGFTVLIAPEHATRLSVGRPWTLDYDNGKFEVHAQWFFHAPDGHVQVGVRRLRDLTKLPELPKRKHHWLSPLVGTDEGQTSSLAFAGFFMVLLCAMALPGLGDKLGTQQRIGGMFKAVFSTLMNLI